MKAKYAASYQPALLEETRVDRRTLSTTVPLAVYGITPFVVFGLWMLGGWTSTTLTFTDYVHHSVLGYSYRSSSFDLVAGSFLRFFSLFLSLGTSFSNVSIYHGGRLPLLRRLALVAIPLAAAVNYAVKFGLVFSQEPAERAASLEGFGGQGIAVALLVLGLGLALGEAVPLGIFHVRARLLALDQMFLRQMEAGSHTPTSPAVTGAELDPKADAPGEPNSKATLMRLLSLVRPEMGLLLVGCFALLITALTQLALPFLIGVIVDALVPVSGSGSSSDFDPRSNLNQAVVLLLIVATIGAITGLARASVFTLIGHRIVFRLRRDLFHAITSQDIAFFDQTRTGDLASRLSSDSQVIQNSMTVNLSMLLRYIVQIFGSVIVLFLLSWQLSLIMFSVVPLVTIGAVAYGKYLRTLQKKFQEALADALTVAEEVISNMRTVRSFSGEDRSNQQYTNATYQSYLLGRKIAFVYGLFNGLLGFVPQAAIALVLWYGGVLVIEGRITTGLLTSFLIYTLSVAMAFAFLSSLFGDFMAAVGASERVFGLIDRVPTIPVKGGLRLPSLTGHITFDRVSFTYPSRPDSQILDDIQLDLAPGRVLALVGPSGGGKSTIVSLLERFYDVTSGKILVDGHDLRTLDPKWYRSQVALVSQEPVLFATTIRENIAFGIQEEFSYQHRSAAGSPVPGSFHVPEEDIINAARQANAHDFISAFPQGYDTLVGERGVRLSGGQKQRIAIARALLMNPRILLLDEATSALDAESEFQVQEAIDRAMESRTVLVIAHRLSTVKNADAILVLQGGKIVERGTHDQLIARRKGVYRGLVLRQLQGGPDPAAPGHPKEDAPEDPEDQEAARLAGIKNLDAQSTHSSLSPCPSDAGDSLLDVVEEQAEEDDLAILPAAAAASFSINEHPSEFGSINTGLGPGLGGLPRQRRGSARSPPIDGHPAAAAAGDRPEDDDDDDHGGEVLNDRSPLLVPRDH
ncbi:hypothetical protein H696_05849 [Fonticula alba]|uniref:ATP-binding cassette, subfamily B (MDR/TAP), member 1 n=1 Tax=Fonticula alba TaxID=691883 RepID=A0A058Z0F5_FONAL|nr:hypothetical protein H696_05849 [Fonticula alba]KCV67740.1 hypothetical protein H696_05849 [Fonticula alba]|eukprot:XP_009497924.1 hypothetical protein H696_05849 [Fonticula alba]